jgi:Flp pilus assembly protein TadD
MPSFAREAVALAAAALLLLSGCARLEAARLYNSGTAALDRGDSARAIAELERAATLAPDVSAIQNHLGLAYQGAGRSDDALQAFERAVQLDCENEAAQENLAVTRARLGRVDPRGTAAPPGEASQ